MSNKNLRKAYHNLKNEMKFIDVWKDAFNRNIIHVKLKHIDGSVFTGYLEKDINLTSDTT